MEKNLRTCPRVEVNLPVHYKYLENGRIYHALEGEAANVGAKGLAMRGDRPLLKGQVMLVTLFLPPESRSVDQHNYLQITEQNGLPIIILAEVAWCQSLGERYTAGLQFLVPDNHHQRRLRNFLDNYHIYRQVRYADLPSKEDENEP